jgi:hypothetical protein
VILDDALRILRTRTGREREHAYAAIVEAVTPYLRKLARGSPDNLQDLLVELFLSIESAEGDTLPEILQEACEFYGQQKRPNYCNLRSLDTECFRDDFNATTYAELVTDEHRYTHLRAPYEDDPAEPKADQPAKTRFHVPAAREMERQTIEIEQRLAWVEQRQTSEATVATVKLEMWERQHARRQYRSRRVESGLRGATRCEKRNRWRADFSHNGTQYYLGHYSTQDAATAKVKEAEANPEETINRLAEGRQTRLKTTGVHLDRRSQKWKACGSCKGRKIYLGYYDSQDEALAARRRWKESAVEPSN